MNAYSYPTPDAWSAMERRRSAAADSWSPPEAAPAPAAPAGGGVASQYGPSGGALGSSGDALLDWIRNMANSDAGARIRSARLAARRSAPDDPSLAAFADLEALLGGQGDAARAVNEGAFQRAGVLDARGWEEYLLRLRRKWQEEDAQRAASAGLWGDLANVGGRVASAAFL